ncbi:DNA-binding SARP family transcriptional activator/type II secretory pathway predicted ATPase ExeA [Kibdelosporangium banguiense]|uniref:DNA-binding SARP family transcriptional activator/type II secretory pathway predicted ATPase ExeA n=1 Tax=Kibdelosporangium banguiense TaxID=1365924 RepID=A0ABS4TNW3_9PSEU|nr:AfsR/SARP family transcriptional regulator [Kibdelosporangium banguiense]MBP2326092.1 DNA-binding SARP family transcriptional activator/type II secretory pathway predicted ATPase ExeA [Kibdelosporangium banguiense]
MQVRLFGSLEVVDGSGQVLDLGTRKQRALVAMLASQPGQIVSLDRLINELWADEAPAGATRTLQAYIAHLRKILEPGRRPRTPPEVLLTREPGYQLAIAPDDVDLCQFSAWADEGRQALARGEHREAVGLLDRAMTLWRGDPLGEFADEEFAQPVLTRLVEQRAAALENRFEARLALGEDASLVPGLESLVAEWPYRERAWSLLVLALYRASRQAEALTALRRVRTLLADDLGLQPGPDLRDLEQAVFDQSPQLQLPQRPAEPPVPVQVADGLIARAAELALIEHRLAGAGRGDGGAVLITGEAGIGKSRLVQAATDLALARGFSVAVGRCVDGTAPAFWPWAQVLRSDLLTRHSATTEALYELYDQVMAALTETPLVLVLDDLHWADASSLRLLAFVAQEAARHRLLVLATCRPEPGDHPQELRDTLAALSRQQCTDRIELTPFTADEIALYLRAKGEEPELAEALWERTGGNPFYIGEVLRLRAGERELPGVVPQGARTVLDRRVARLPEETRTLLRAAAVAGREVDIDLLEAVTDASTEEVMTGMEPAVASGLIVEPSAGADYRFSHALVRDALYAGLSRLERSRLHLRAGEALEPVLPEAESARLAHHFVQAARLGGADKAVKYASRAARHATGQLAHTEAVEFWELALNTLAAGRDAERARVLTELGQAFRSVGQPEKALHAWAEAVQLARRTDDKEALIPAVTAMGGPSLWNWRPYGVVDSEMVTVLEGLLRGPLTDADRATLLGTLAVELCYGPRWAEGEQYAAEAVELARTTGKVPLLARTLSNYLLAAFRPGRNTARRAAAEELASLPGLPVSAEVLARVFLMSCMLRDSDLAGWDRELARCEQLLDTARRPEIESIVRVAQPARSTLEGRWDEAQALLAGYSEPQFGSTLWGSRFRRWVITFTCLRAQGRMAGMLDELVAAAKAPDLVPLRPVAVLAAAEAGREALARELIALWGTDIPEDWVADFLIPVWGLVAARLGTPDPQQLYDRLLPYAGQFVVAGMGTACWGSAHLVLAELAQRLGKHAQARDHAQAALDIHERLGLTYWAGQSRRLLTAKP